MNDIIKAYLEEYETDLKNCEKEIDNLYKELEVYKKALELACNEIEERDCRYYRSPIDCKGNCDMWDVCSTNIKINDYFVMKAREE